MWVPFHKEFFYYHLPTGAIVYSLNSRGGSSGSGVFNQQGEILALHHAGNTTYGFGVDPQYLTYLLSFVKNNKTPVRRHIGAITRRFSVADIPKYASLPEGAIEAYKKQLPKNTAYVIVVYHLLKGTPAEGVLQPGDIIYSANGQVLGGSLAKLDILMSSTPHSTITLGILRKDMLMDVEVGLYDVDKHKITKMVDFCGTIFFEANDCWANEIAMPAGTLTFYNTFEGKSLNTSKYFNKICFHGKVTALDGIPVANLDQLIAFIPKLMAKKNFTMNYTNVRQEEFVTLIDRSDLDTTPTIYTYNPKTLAWDIEKINL